MSGMRDRIEQQAAGEMLARAGLSVIGSSGIRAHDSGWIITGSDLSVRHQLNPVNFYRHGWQSWSMAGWQPFDRPPATIAAQDLQRQADDPGLEGRTDHVGSWVGVIETEDGAGLLLGALGMDARVSVGDGCLRGETEREIEWFLCIGDSDVALELYGQVLGSLLGTRRHHSGSVWCSWYSQGRSLDPHSLRALISQVADLPFDTFLIDDGWERAIGDWRPNQSFADGMGPMADAIAGAGMRPGLWLAPFAVEADEADQWKGLLIRDDKGDPLTVGRNWGTHYHGVDLTNPTALGMVIESLQTAVSWGFAHLKLDFLFAGAVPGGRQGDALGEHAYRHAVLEIRAALGDDVHLNACGAPIVPSVGVFDSIRVGPDVAPYWESSLYEHAKDYSAPGTRRAIATSLARLWLESAIRIDTDVAFFRTRNNLLDREQRELLQDVGRVTSSFATSDPPDWLTTDEVEDLTAFLTDRPEITRLDRDRFRIGDRLVDFSDAVEGAFG